MGDNHESPEETEHGVEIDELESKAIRFYQGLRRDVSLLLSEGHPEAGSYILATLWSESRIVRQRHAIRIQQEAVLLQAAITSVLAGDKEFGKLLKRVGNVG